MLAAGLRDAAQRPPRFHRLAVPGDIASKRTVENETIGKRRIFLNLGLEPIEHDVARKPLRTFRHHDQASR